MSLCMPAEWEPHAATWMGFPPEAYPGSGVSTDDAQGAWAEVANLIADHEPVHMLCNTKDMKTARKRLSASISLHEYPLNDAWLRDTGPTFVIGDSTQPQLTAIDWQFNGWGDNTSFDWQADAGIARHVAGLTAANIQSSSLTNEGGGIHVNAQGTVLLTDTVQLDPNRNPDWSRDRVEAEIHRQLGTDKAIWLQRGLYRDYLSHGTRGHVDIVACFAPDGSILLHQQTHGDHPDAALYPTLLETFEQAGHHVRPIPAPQCLKDKIDWVDYSYINHYVANGVVILPTFDDKQDDATIEHFAEIYPGRDIRAVDARVIFAMGGGVHCITQQQPLIPGV